MMELSTSAYQMYAGEQSGWNNWKRVFGVLSDRNMNVKIKGNVSRTVVRPALVYGAETLALEKTQENKLEVAEMSMLRWMNVKIKGEPGRCTNSGKTSTDVRDRDMGVEEGT